MHTYLTVADFQADLADGSSSTPTGLLRRLEAASRRVDEWCGRSRFGSGFGPRIGTNRYSPDPDEHYRLWLDDDLVAITELTVAYTTGATGVAYTEETDFYLVPFDRTPKRMLTIGIPGSAMSLPALRRNVSATA